LDHHPRTRPRRQARLPREGHGYGVSFLSVDIELTVWCHQVRHPADDPKGAAVRISQAQLLGARRHPYDQLPDAIADQ
jgi:hypothetical protein